MTADAIICVQMLTRGPATLMFTHLLRFPLVVVCALGTHIASAEEDILQIDPELETSGSVLVLPVLDPARGRELFVTKGCVVCHAINGVGGKAISDLGGEPGPSLEAAKLGPRPDPFDFFAKMWRGARQMIDFQEQQLGYQIGLRGDEIADMMAFLYDQAEQDKFTAESFTPPIFWYRTPVDDDTN